MGSSLIGAVLAALAGGVLAYVNYRLTALAARRENSTSLSFVPVVRMLLSVGYLALLYLAGPLTPWDPVWLLAGGAAGLTLPAFAFTFLLLQKLPGKDATSGDTANSTAPKGGND